MATRFIWDFGNARCKWFIPSTNTFDDFVHAVVPLAENTWQSIVGRGTPPKGLLRIDGKPFAVGDAARRYILKAKPHGAARYRRDYYLAALVNAMVEAFKTCEDKYHKDIALYASHAPQDQMYVPNLVQAAQGPVSVECFYGNLTFDVQKVVTFDEPMGGYAHFAFTPNGVERPDNPVANKIVLMIDVGGYTTDHMSIDEHGHLDMLSLGSIRAGTIAALESFEEELRRNNRDYFQTTGDLDIRRIESAIITGTYHYGKIDIACQAEAQAAISGLVNDVIQVINRQGGAANYDLVLLTGGGSALIYDALVEAFPNIDFVMVDSDRSLLKYANVFGGGKIAAILSRMRG